MKDVEFCPIKGSAMKGFPQCEGRECAWFIKGKCAMTLLAESLDRLANAWGKEEENRA